MYHKEGLPFVIHSLIVAAGMRVDWTKNKISNGMQNLLSLLFFPLHTLWPSYDEHLDDESDRSYPCRQPFILYHSCLTEYMHILSHSCSIIALCQSVTNNRVLDFALGLSLYNFFQWSPLHESVSSRSFHIPFTSHDDSNQTQWQAYVRITLTGSTAENVLSDPQYPSYLLSKPFITTLSLTLQRPLQCLIISVECVLASSFLQVSFHLLHLIVFQEHCHFNDDLFYLSRRST